MEEGSSRREYHYIYSVSSTPLSRNLVLFLFNQYASQTSSQYGKGYKKKGYIRVRLSAPSFLRLRSQRPFEGSNTLLDEGAEGVLD